MTTTSLAVVDSVEQDLRRDSHTCTEAENLARHILARIESVAAKLKNLEDDIRRLWVAFENLKSGETILGCATKKEFCERKLHRTPRAVQYMLVGGNPNENVHYTKAEGSEIISPVSPVSPAAEQAALELALSKVIEQTGATYEQVQSIAFRKSSPRLSINHIEKRKWRSEPVDDFETLRKLAMEMLNLGFNARKKLPLPKKIDGSHLDSALTWARCCIQEKQTPESKLELAAATRDFDSAMSTGDERDCSITTKNVKDTRCLSMAQHRLNYAAGKAQILVQLIDDSDAKFGKAARDALLIYRTAFQIFQTFSADGVQFINKHLDGCLGQVQPLLPSEVPASVAGTSEYTQTPASSQVTDEEFARYETKHPNGIRAKAADLLGRNGVTPADVIGMLVKMSFPKPMAEAAVRITTAKPPLMPHV